MTRPVETTEIFLLGWFILLGAFGTFLLLPHRHGQSKPRRVHSAGAILLALALPVLLRSWTAPGPFLSGLFFYAFALAAVAGAVLTVVSRNPVYSALWFATVVLASTGLFLLAEAQFLAAGTIIVYAGAIIVTFLFVIMLAQSTGLATYDRSARSPLGATATSFALMAALLYALLIGQANGPRPEDQPPIPSDGVVSVKARALRPTLLLPEPTVLAAGRPTPHVAGLGGTLFTDHLISVEVSGILLFVALVGALVIATPKPPIRPGDRRAAVTVPTS